MPSAQMNVLLLCSVPPASAGTTHDHVDALRRHSAHRVMCFPYLGEGADRLPRDLELDRFDAIVIHYSVYLLADRHLGPADRERIAAFPGVKLLFLQDEYRQIDRVTALIAGLGIDVLFTCVPGPEVGKVYPPDRLPALTVISNLTGYVSAAQLGMRVARIAQRPVDVGYRARVPPFWLGRLSAEKWQIATRFLEAVQGTGLKCDISQREEDRIYGKRWPQFVSSCKAMLGVESGASVFDFDGSIQRDVEAFMAENPQAGFEEVESRFLRAHEGRIRLNQISPRCFEAAALRTAMVLYEGEYSGILKPWRHYVPLCKDFSNIDEVVAAIKDERKLQEIADRAYEEIALNPQWSYEAFAGRFDAALQAAQAAKGRSVERPISGAAFALASLPAAIFSFLLHAWLSIPEGVRGRLKPLLQPLISGLTRPGPR